MEKMRLVSSGTEATMSAIRARPRLHRRDVIVKFDGCYHGHVDSLLVAGRRPARRRSACPTRPACRPARTADTLVAALTTTPAASKRPFAGRRPDRRRDPRAGRRQHGRACCRAEFLAALRGITEQHGALLIFDEVMTGFRVAYGGAQALFGI